MRATKNFNVSDSTHESDIEKGSLFLLAEIRGNFYLVDVDDDEAYRFKITKKLFFAILNSQQLISIPFEYLGMSPLADLTDDGYTLVDNADELFMVRTFLKFAGYPVKESRRGTNVSFTLDSVSNQKRIGKYLDEAYDLVSKNKVNLSNLSKVIEKLEKLNAKYLRTGHARKSDVKLPSNPYVNMGKKEFFDAYWKLKQDEDAARARNPQRYSQNEGINHSHQHDAMSSNPYYDSDELKEFVNVKMREAAQAKKEAEQQAAQRAARQYAEQEKQRKEYEEAERQREEQEVYDLAQDLERQFKMFGYKADKSTQELAREQLAGKAMYSLHYNVTPEQNLDEFTQAVFRDAVNKHFRKLLPALYLGRLFPKVENERIAATVEKLKVKHTFDSYPYKKAVDACISDVMKFSAIKENFKPVTYTDYYSQKGMTMQYYIRMYLYRK